MRWLVILTLLLAGCARTVYVPQESVRTEIREVARLDSVVVRDSVFVGRRADTVYIVRDRWRDRYRMQHDTVVVRDSVSYPVVVEVDRPVRHIPRIYRWSLWVAVAAVGWVVFRVARR